jgi:YHS domain-containing protein
MQAPSDALPFIDFDGRRYRLFQNSRYYRSFQSNPRAIRYLHRDVWSKQNGEIPAGYHVHHVDGDPFNNSLENLSCISLADHNAEHSEERSQRGKGWVLSGHLKKMQMLTKNWHKSDDGRRWHKIHSKIIWSRRKPIAKTCKQCSRSYSTLDLGRAYFCSKACKAANRRDRGVDNEQRKCLICSAEFTAGKYLPHRTCSRSCGARLRGQTMKARLMAAV